MAQWPRSPLPTGHEAPAVVAVAVVPGLAESRRVAHSCEASVRGAAPPASSTRNMVGCSPVPRSCGLQPWREAMGHDAQLSLDHRGRCRGGRVIRIVGLGAGAKAVLCPLAPPFDGRNAKGRAHARPIPAPAAAHPRRSISTARWRWRSWPIGSLVSMDTSKAAPVTAHRNRDGTP